MGEMSASHISFRHGPLLLGMPNDPRSKPIRGLPKPLGGARYQASDGSLLGPLGDATWLPEEACKKSVYKVLFAAEGAALEMSYELKQGIDRERGG